MTNIITKIFTVKTHKKLSENYKYYKILLFVSNIYVTTAYRLNCNN